jgi:eukaryotic-like serine/threonine-protein kinase
MAPEQIRGQVDRRTDVFAAAVCLWEALAGRRLHEGLKDVEIVTRVVQGKFVAPSTYASGIPHDLDQIVLKGLAADPKKRYLTAKDMAADIESKIGLMDRSQITAWVEKLAKPTLDKRAAKVAAMEKAAKDLRPSSSALRMPSLTTPDAFVPVSIVETTSLPRSDKDVQAELDSVAPTTPPPYTPSPEVMAAARAGVKPPVPTAKRDPSASSKGAAAKVGDKPPPPPSSSSLRTATPLLPIVPVGAPVPNVAATPPGPNDTGHTQLTPSGTEVPFLAADQAPSAQPQSRGALIYVLLAASMLLALAGAGLGGYAIAQRGRVPPEPAPKVTPTNPSVTTPPVPSPTMDPPPLPASASAKVPMPMPKPTTTTTATAPSTDTADPIEPSASASASAAGSSAPSTSAAPTTTTTSTTTSTAKRPVPKPAAASCDPPFVLDEGGNKKFKPECMGL